jgi:hypothetical protein
MGSYRTFPMNRDREGLVALGVLFDAQLCAQRNERLDVISLTSLFDSGTPSATKIYAFRPHRLAITVRKLSSWHYHLPFFSPRPSFVASISSSTGHLSRAANENSSRGG